MTEANPAHAFARCWTNNLEAASVGGLFNFYR